MYLIIILIKIIKTKIDESLEQKKTLQLLETFFVGRAGFEPAKVSQRIYSPSSLAA